jgi:hypothetical protein
LGKVLSKHFGRATIQLISFPRKFGRAGGKVKHQTEGRGEEYLHPLPNSQPWLSRVGNRGVSASLYRDMVFKSWEWGSICILIHSHGFLELGMGSICILIHSHGFLELGMGEYLHPYTQPWLSKVGNVGVFASIFPALAF